MIRILLYLALIIFVGVYILAQRSDDVRGIMVNVGRIALQKIFWSRKSALITLGGFISFLVILGNVTK